VDFEVLCGRYQFRQQVGDFSNRTFFDVPVAFVFSQVALLVRCIQNAPFSASGQIPVRQRAHF
jgi:hypothetical protein